MPTTTPLESMDHPAVIEEWSNVVEERPGYYPVYELGQKNPFWIPTKYNTEVVNEFIPFEPVLGYPLAGSGIMPNYGVSGVWNGQLTFPFAEPPPPPVSVPLPAPKPYSFPLKKPSPRINRND